MIISILIMEITNLNELKELIMGDANEQEVQFEEISEENVAISISDVEGF